MIHKYEYKTTYPAGPIFSHHRNRNPILLEYITFFNNQYSPKLFTLNSKYTIENIKQNSRFCFGYPRCFMLKFWGYNREIF